MEVTGRFTQQKHSSNLNCSAGRNDGSDGGSAAGGTDKNGVINQISDRGYDGSSEGTQRQPVNTAWQRRRSRSWHRNAQQLKHSGVQNGLVPLYRGKRWRRRYMRKQPCIDSIISAPPPSPTIASTEKESHQQQRLNNSIVGSVNEMQSDKLLKTCVTNGTMKLTFQVQLAHGSPTGIISGFNSIIQLYQAIANCYDEITMDDILFCTVNTHRISMDDLLCSNLSINDFIFAHIAGQKKEVTLVKTEPALGLTITDNGAGKAFIKRIVPDTVTSKAKPALEVGDFIEKINGESMIGRRHYDVARYLRTLPTGSTFTMRLVEPKRSGFNFIASYSKPKRILSLLGPNETIRFKADGTVAVQEVPNVLIINKMNDIFDSYFGFHDNDLAQTVWELVASCKDFSDLKNILKKA
uniref:PDZ domain-containing protein n=1 Tax=Setaria digitata TaxID=48799 RepID=A0A915Q7P7_9BILA